MFVLEIITKCLSSFPFPLLLKLLVRALNKIHIPQFLIFFLFQGGEEVFFVFSSDRKYLDIKVSGAFEPF